MKKWLIFYAVLVVVCSAVLFSMHGKKEDPRSPHVIAAGRIINRAVDHMKQKYNLSAVSTGGAMPFDIQSLSIGLRSYSKLTVEEARRLVVACEEDFIEIMNNDAGAIPYLRRYPADEKMANLYIIFSEPNAESVCKPYVASVSVFFGKMTFDFRDTPDQLCPSYSEVETLQEAQAIVHGSAGQEKLSELRVYGQLE